nr:sigma-54-dependent Fis family transcriptional regulator [Gemmatimonadota bacterium]NIR36894.1 sigma-54-dependent Fis family transcriptional regulator [Actinomycetota bacterium]NIX20737.1 sigma-54-dependent Fis family transcriptional regulator [Actinomycetota bacterium]
RLVDVDVRVVAATNANLTDAMQRGDFRQDLYYRLNVVGLELPPLRSRREDIPLLASRFLEEFAESTGRNVPEVSPEAWRVLRRYHWPGNIRQLRNVIHCLVALDEDGLVTVADLPTEVRFPRAAPNGAGFCDSSTLDYARARDTADRAFRASYLERLLDAHDGNVSAAAKTAGVSRRSIHRWIAELEGRDVGGTDENR